MRQRRWIELFSDYDCEIRYHPGKANVVADALIRKERVKSKRVQALSMTIKSGIKEKLLAAQSETTKEENALAKMLHSLDQQMENRGDGGLYFMDRICIPFIGTVRTMIMDEAHATRYSIHPGEDKMYYDLRDRYWWPDDMQTPLLSNAKSSKFNTVDTIPFNINETLKSTDGSSKGNGSNGDGEGSSKAIEIDGGDSGSGKCTIIDLDDYDEYEAKAKRVKDNVNVDLNKENTSYVLGLKSNRSLIKDDGLDLQWSLSNGDDKDKFKAMKVKHLVKVKIGRKD
nr:putative reverse transcriptase domain-containing protein [Tanacetum cinerariifolium]